ncbi:aminoglycoside phosphotransferase family protein [Legionella bozemanae]|uniref:aminoglycoside phosphotransferase family protein n=1 Tax=Legionella bozemanae TaxID=447 RepID=UPI003EEB9A92
MTNHDKIHIDVFLVQRLIAMQFPEWASLEIKPVELSGWDNKTFHLGEHMTVRLPSHADYSSQVETEQYWLPKLAPQLPLAIAMPIAMGKPGLGYPLHWSIYKWIEGNTASIKRIKNLPQFAVALAEFLNALQQCDPTGGPLAGEHNFYRGGALATYDTETREAIASLDDKTYAEVTTEIWNLALSSTWQSPPVWVHGDIAIGNLLVNKNQLSAVIDFGQLCIGDPACDLAIAWTLFTRESRDAFRATLKLDSATWARGRGWTLWKALCWAFPGEKRVDWRVVDEVIADHRREYK